MSVEGYVGRCEVLTENGSVYLLDFDAGTVARHRADDGVDLRQDSTACPLLHVLELRLGRPMRLLVDVRGDGVDTLRVTSAVRRIERLWT